MCMMPDNRGLQIIVMAWEELLNLIFGREMGRILTRKDIIGGRMEMVLQFNLTLEFPGVEHTKAVWCLERNMLSKWT